MTLDLYENETSGDAPIDAAGPADAAAAADPSEGSAAPESDALASGETAAAAEAPTEPTAPSIDWDDPLIQQQAAPYIQQQLAATLQQLGIVGEPAAEPGMPEYDPFDPESVQGYVDHLFQQREAQQQQAQREVQQVSSYVEQAAKASPALQGIDGASEAITFAASGFDALAQAQTGSSNPQWAVQQAAQYLNTIVANARTAAVNDYKASIGGGNGTQADPAVTGAAVGIEPKATSFDEVIARWDSRTAA